MSQTRIAGVKWIFLLLAVTMMATPAVAQGAVQPSAPDGTTNANVETNPANAGGDQLAGETVNLHVSSGDGPERVFSFDVTEDERIEDLERGTREDATVEMRTDLSTFQRIAHAPNPERKFRTAVEQGTVQMQGADASDGAEYDVLDDVAELARSLGLS